MILATEKRESKEIFCESLGWTIDVLWFGLTGYSKIDRFLQAKIEMCRPGPAASFDKFRVTILNKTEGKVDSCEFSFDEYLHAGQEPRLEHVRANMNDEGKFAWDKCVIKSLRPSDLIQAIQTYIWTFK